jgi:hypothetical protein
MPGRGGGPQVPSQHRLPREAAAHDSAKLYGRLLRYEQAAQAGGRTAKPRAQLGLVTAVCCDLTN